MDGGDTGGNGGGPGGAERSGEDSECMEDADYDYRSTSIFTIIVLHVRL